MNNTDSRYTLEQDLEEAEAAARELPGQIARIRQRVRQAKADLTAGQVHESSPAEG